MNIVLCIVRVQLYNNNSNNNDEQVTEIEVRQYQMVLSTTFH